MNLPNLLLPLAIVVLSWAAGKYWLGPSDATKRIKGIKHDGRRFVYRGAAVALVCAFFVWRTSWGWPAAFETLLAAGFAMSIGVRTGFNAASGLDWRYLGNTSIDDAMCIVVCMRPKPIPERMSLVSNHQAWYHRKSIEVTGWNDGVVEYTRNVHRAGAIRTLAEGLASLIIVTLTILA